MGYTTGALGTPTDTVTYAYDSVWKDKLVSYDGEAITYDEIGNPLSYRGYTMAWEGKRLQSLSGNNTTASYTYDEQGVRSSKTVNNVTTTFSYNGSLLMAQVQGSGSSQVKQLYSYDASGQLISVNYNGTEYYYLRNGQTDIVGLMDGSGTKVVEYTYDAWGKLISTTGTLATTLGADNPFRYRGYYYDTETGLYYLMTRYYDPEVCRFISADVYMTTGQGVLGGNMFAYCGNNPIIRYDDQGRLLDTIFDIVSLGFSIAEVIANPADPWAWLGLAGDIVDLVPIVSGVGEATKAIGATVKVANAADTATDTIKIVKAVDLSEDAVDTARSLDRVNGFTKSTRGSGIKIHSGYKRGNKFPLEGKEYRKVKGVRPDYVDFDSNTIYELKPMNPRGVKSGIRQLQRYNKALGGGFKLQLELY